MDRVEVIAIGITFAALGFAGKLWAENLELKKQLQKTADMVSLQSNVVESIKDFVPNENLEDLKRAINDELTAYYLLNDV